MTISDSNSTLTLLGCQIAIPSTETIHERDKHLSKSAKLVSDELQRQHSELVVLPELSTIDYSRTCFTQLHSLAEDDKGPSYACWAQVAKENNCAVVYGFPRKVKDGFRISTGIVSKTGELAGIYDKIHLAQFGDSMEKEYFTTGGEQLVVFTVGDFKIAPIICYDIRFPELCRTLVTKHEVDLILHVGAYARDASFYSWHAFATTRAVENQCFFLSLNRAGEHFGHSVFCTPWIDQQNLPTTFSETGQELRQLVLDKNELNQARSQFTFLQDKLASYELPVQ